MSTAPITPWNWVIKALANYEQIDLSTLIGLVKYAHATSEELGKDVREMVSLRILESLFVHGNKVTVYTDSARKATICPDLIELCEDVLQQILHETPEMMTESKKEKQDVLPFLIHKRSSLPKCSLEKVKNIYFLRWKK